MGAVSVLGFWGAVVFQGGRTLKSWPLSSPLSREWGGGTTRAKSWPTPDPRQDRAHRATQRRTHLGHACPQKQTEHLKKNKVLEEVESTPPFKTWHWMANSLTALGRKDPGTLGSPGAGVGPAGLTGSSSTSVMLQV